MCGYHAAQMALRQLKSDNRAPQKYGRLLKIRNAFHIADFRRTA